MYKPKDIVKVLIPNVVNRGYDYQLIQSASLGAFVRVSVMNKNYIGVIIGGGDSKLPITKIKPVQEVIDMSADGTIGGYPIVSHDVLTWIQKMSDWTMMTPGAVLRLIINTEDAFLPPKQEQLYLLDLGEKIRLTEQRQAIADAFSSNDSEPMSALDIQNIAKVSPSVVRTMIKNQMLVAAQTRDVIPQNNYNYKYFDNGSVVLNKEQEFAAAQIGKHINQDSEFSVHLIDGITGSGKTQVYFDSAWRSFNSGKSVLLMMPEIALTAQFMTRFQSRFGEKPVVWHSNLTAQKRREIWRGVAIGEIRMLVGTRSALFLPWQELGLIVIDEEHDGSYKQEDMGNYHARDMAILRASISKFPIILASATPSAETIKNAEQGRYSHLKLTSRFGGAQMPIIETIDMRKDKPELYTPIIDSKSPKDSEISESLANSENSKTPGNISTTLEKAIQETLDNKQQIMLFINRRGFAPIVQCKKCGWTAQCDDCSVGMTYHKKLGKLLCHICGKTSLTPKTCPDCKNETSMYGIGLEKIQEEVRAKFPNAQSEIVSSDTVSSRQALERLISRMESGDIDIIIGTQILAKGHHFPNLTLVGVVESDSGLFGTDFRAGEHTFQQLFQVSGRAGRGDKPGRVMLQTYQPEHPVMRAICEGNRDSFMESDMKSRKIAKMPPYGNLVAVIIEAKTEYALNKYVKELSRMAPTLVSQDGAASARIMGPIVAGVYQIRNWYRMRFLVMGDERANLQPVVSHWLSKVPKASNVRVKIDVNPQNFM